ncbi:MAG: hypothetical protein AAGF85_18060 [Bacteroidota bacterium]
MRSTKCSLIISIAVITGFFSCQNKINEADPCTEFDQIDKEMLDLMEEIKTKHRTDAIFLKRFEMERVYWNQYRDRRLRAIYPQDWDTHYRKKFGKEVFNKCKCKELLRMSKNRLIDLKLYVEEGPAEQEKCPSMLGNR